MREIFRTLFGAHLYGTETPQSDLDYKAVHVPGGRDILLGRARETLSSTTKAPGVVKNIAGDIDVESYALLKFLNLCADGQTVAMDMLFAPPRTWEGRPTRTWLDIRVHQRRLLSREVRGFLGYCRQQANKYGIKGSRVAAASLIREVFRQAEAHEKVWEVYSYHPERFADIEHVAVIQHPTRNGQTEPMIEVCGRKIPFTVTATEAFAIVDRLYQEYGARARAAERSEGVDWKALSHAVRVGRQAVELLQTSHVTFPRPEAAHLVAIKTGQLTYQPVAEEIEQLLVEVETAAQTSSLPEKPDRAWIDHFVVEVYGQRVMEGLR